LHSTPLLLDENHHNESGEGGSAPYNRPMGLAVEESESEYILKKRYDLAADNIQFNKVSPFGPNY
jgi:hypothetical protein